MTRSQELAQFHIREAEIEHEAELDRLRDTVAELKIRNAELRAELEKLAPMRAVQEALHALLLRSDVVQYHAPSNTLTLGPATFAALGDEAILRELATAAKAFTEDR